MKTNKILFKLSIALLASAAIMLVAPHIVRADEGGGSDALPYCTKVSATWSLESSSTTMGVCEHAGHGWMHFEYLNDYKGTIDFAPEIGYMSTVTIPEVCSEWGGFMHYGYFQYKNASGSRGSSSASINGLGHIGSPTLSGAGGIGTRAKGDGWVSPNGKSSWDKIMGYNGGGGTHIIYKNGSPVAQNTGPVSFSDAWTDYLEWRSSESAANFPQLWSNGDNADGGSGNINWFCSGKNPHGSGFEGKIEATLNGHRVPDGYTEKVPAGTEITIDYTDSVKRRPDSVPVNPVNITFSGRDDKNAGSGYTARKDISSGETVYQPATATITINSATTICHYLTHPVTLSQEGVVGGSSEKKLCVTFVLESTPQPTSNQCGDIGVSYGNYHGESDAQMIFSFNGTEYKLGRGGNGNTKSVWAVPGDSVKYTYKMCGSSENPRYYPNDRPLKTLQSFGAAPANEPSFVISAQSARHVFDLEKTTFKKGDLSSYFRMVTTPKDSRYYCQLTGGRGQSANHFQIPASGVGSCSSSSIADTDVGKTRYQQLTYSKIKASERSERVEPFYETTCWCASRTSDGNGGTTCSDYTCTTYPVYNYEYWSEMDYNRSTTLKGEYKTPYNYQLVPYTKRFGHNDGVVYAGSTFNTASYVATIQRQNNDTNKKYATHTKSTKLIVAYFTTDSNGISSLPGKSMQRLSGSFNKNTICNAFGVHVVTCDEKTSMTTVLNRHTGQLKGATDESINISSGGSSVNGIMSISVPIVPPGLKMCVAVGVYPADSHDNVADSSVAAMSETGSYYSIGAPACVTIAKKPMFSVESGDFYTNGSVKASTSTVGSRIFGSWTEYGLIAAGDVGGMGSGAAYGYKDTPYNNSNNNYAGTLEGRYRIGIVDTGASDGGISTGALSDCSYSQQTYGNEDCSFHLGHGTVLMNSSNVTNVLDRIKKIYLKTPAQLNAKYEPQFGVRDLSADATVSVYHPETGATINIQKTNISGTMFSPILELPGTEAACKYNQSLGRYVADTSSRTVKTRNIDNNGNISGGSTYTAPSVYCTSDGNKYYRSSSNAIITSGLKNSLGQPVVGGAGTSDLDHEGNVVKDSYRNPVYIYDVKGTLVIDANIITHNGSKGDNFESLDQIPVVIFMADNIIITDRVNRIDAWIITPGNLNTCGVDTSGMSNNTIWSSSSVTNGSISGLKMIQPTDLNSNKCNTELLINGTVFADSVTLNRTYGGGATATNDTASFIKRGEIFNQRADAFYWSYYQAQRSRVMTTVYSRELPTRF